MASIKVRQATAADLDEYEHLQGQRWSVKNRVDRKQLENRFKSYPEGMLVAEENDKIVGMVFAMRITDYDYDNPPSWYDITNNGMCDNHDPAGKIIFGVDLTTAPGVGARAGDALLLGVGRLAIKERVKWCMLGGRMPGYHEYKGKMSAEEYLWAKNYRGERLDRQVRFYASVPGLKVIKAIPNYFSDPESCDYGVLLRWRNPLYELPMPRLWSMLFPVLFKLEDKYISLRKAWRSHKAAAR